jgi:hypothetical protein
MGNPAAVLQNAARRSAPWMIVYQWPGEQESIVRQLWLIFSPTDVALKCWCAETDGGRVLRCRYSGATYFLFVVGVLALGLATVMLLMEPTLELMMVLLAVVGVLAVGLWHRRTRMGTLRHFVEAALCRGMPEDYEERLRR